MGCGMSSDASAMPAGGAQAVMIMTVPPELEERVTKFWELHAKWMAYTHGPEVEDFTSGPSAKKTGNVTFTITEFYATPAGLDTHFAMFAAGHAEMAEFGKEFGELMATGKVKFSGHGYGTTVASIGAAEFPPTYDGFEP
ncbi:hypothetical protein JL720_5463 [Aureococcus anophagefferens]|nr:hypothetical protein JL720_5463 [Aureococcus anophagefferens]